MRRVAFMCAALWATVGLAQPLVVLDPGHGGRDPGAVGCNGLQEKVQVVDIGRRIRDLLRESAQVAMTRDNDVFVELRARAAFANDRNARLFVSIHNNANEGAAASGTETWIAVGASNTARQLAGRLQAQMVAEWGLRDRGVKEGRFTVLTATAMPAALTEIAFINRCDPDAALLNNAAERQNIAAAHARAIAEQLGVGGPVDPPPGGQGSVQGVVFEDVGAGLEDTSRRLDQARITVGAQTRNVNPDTAFWQLQLEPATYDIQASAPGYMNATRRCDVVANGETWCSIGLRRAGNPPPEPEPMPEPMPEGQPEPEPAPEGQPEPMPEPAPEGQPEPEGPQPEAMPEPENQPEPEGPAPEGPAPEGPAPEGPAPEGPAPEGPAPEGPAPEGGPPQGNQPEPAPNPNFMPEPDAAGVTSRQSGSFCATAPGRGGAGLLGLLLVLAMGLRRRWMALLGILLATGAQAHVPDVPPEGLDAIGPAASIRLTTPERLVTGRYLAVVPAPDGRALLLVRQGFDQIDLWQPGDLSPQPLITGRGVGRHPIWSADGRVIGVRTPEQSTSAVPQRAFDTQGKEIVPPFRAPAIRAWVKNGRTHVTEAGVTYRIDTPTDRTFRVQMCGEHVIGWDLHRGLWIVRLTDARRFELGSGGHPRCSPDHRYVVFERTRDEGAALTAGDLFRVDLSAATLRPQALTGTADRIELAPAWVGDTLYFIANGDVFRARLASDQ